MVSCSFLHLKALNPEEELCPTVDIDFVWHTHILFSDKYYSDSIAFFRQIFDQCVDSYFWPFAVLIMTLSEDAVEAADLSRRFGFTTRAWQARYFIYVFSANFDIV